MVRSILNKFGDVSAAICMVGVTWDPCRVRVAGVGAGALYGTLKNIQTDMTENITFQNLTML